jgi:putative iron-regulated protein
VRNTWLTAREFCGQTEAFRFYGGPIDDNQGPEGQINAWVPNNAKNYRASFEKGGTESVHKMIVGLGSLSRGELSGERMEVALNSQDQEDEHSCFSDNPLRDIVIKALGIRNVWLGQHQKRDGRAL